MDVNKHKFKMLQILKEVFSDSDLADCLAFKGGTALMFFYDLPRFSVIQTLEIRLPTSMFRTFAAIEHPSLLK